ncbi:MAG: hypothetical protein M3O30_14820 [Planctomycetota bacterium]|nr:hypothetical protein [Planctomycetota bacterium]
MRALQLLFRYTLNNVIFGIALMALAAAYIAIGSGFPSVREYFEMNELEFFNAWPLKLIMILLVSNLATVTWNRIPLTPPRYGVWCIHTGIITLIIGMSLYYHLKIEGRTLIPVNHMVDCFYDSAERSLYARVMDRPIYGIHRLTSLPRFGEYDADRTPTRLQRPDLTNIDHMTPIMAGMDPGNDLGAWLGLQQKIRLDVVGYYSYADIVQDVVEDPASNNVGVEIKIDSPHPGQPGSTLTLTAADPAAARQVLGNTEFEHRDVSEQALAMIRESAQHLLQLTIALPNQKSRKLDVELGKPIQLGNGYTLTADSFNPAFPMSGTHEIVQALTVHIVSQSPAPQQEFWRMILQGRALQTDFKMDPATTPPMVKGNRQKEPLDKDLVLGFTLDDPASLMPTQGDEKHNLRTAGDHALIDIHTSFTHSTEIQDLSTGGQIQIPFDTAPLSAQVRRVDHYRVMSRVIETPPARRVKDDADAGVKQVALIRVTAGSWSQDVPVPCNLYAAPDAMTLEPMIAWDMGIVKIPGANAPLQLQLGYTCRQLPAQLTLRNFEMIHYPGGTGENGPFRDFRSTLEVADPSGEKTIEQASLNNPIYFEGGKWIFFQAGYDPQGQNSTIGIGNRPGVTIMLVGFVLIVVGLMYAFYLKPIVTRRMKAAALARYAARVAPVPAPIPQAQAVAVSSESK